MRHQVAGRKLGRDIKSRKALLNNLADSLFLHGQITTTMAKAKFVQGQAEKMITLARKNRLATNRKIASTISSPSFKRLVVEIAPGFSTRQGGYTRVIKMSPRNGDNAPMAKITLMPFVKSEKLNSKSRKDIKESLVVKTQKTKSKNTKQKTNVTKMISKSKTKARK